jgi:hypothetical protein
LGCCVLEFLALEAPLGARDLQANSPAAAQSLLLPPPHAPRPPQKHAQVAFVGFAVQAIATRTTPLEGLSAHLGDPFGRNITYYLTHIPETLAK